MEGSSIKNIVRTLRLGTTRVQIIFGFLLAIMAVLIIVGIVAYHSTSAYLQTSSEQYVNQIVDQTNGRLDALVAQIDSTTLQIAMDSRIQSLIGKEAMGIRISLDEQIASRNVIEEYKVFAPAIKSIELYSDLRILSPLDNSGITVPLPEEWTRAADLTLGRMVWLNTTDNQPNELMMIRQIRVKDQSYVGGGYIVVRFLPALFEFLNKELPVKEGSLYFLLDEHSHIITTNSSESNPQTLVDKQGTIVSSGTDYYAISKKAQSTKWTLLIMTPKSEILKGTKGLRDGLWLAGIIGTSFFIIIAWVLSTLITKPIRKMMRTMSWTKLSKPRPNDEQYLNYEMNELNSTYNRMVGEINHLIEVIYEKQFLQNRAEIKALQAQIHPHFLFNTLEALNSSLIDREEWELSRLVISLAEIFRYTAGADVREDWVSIDKELNHVNKYMSIMTYRLGDRLQWHCTVDDELLDYGLPKLTIQPLVENCIQHGIQPKIGAGFVALSMTRSVDDRFLLIKVEDNGVGMKQDQLNLLQQQIEMESDSNDNNKGIGLYNVNRRMKLHYGAEYTLSLTHREGGGLIIQLQLPIEGVTHGTTTDYINRR